MRYVIASSDLETMIQGINWWTFKRLLDGPHGINPQSKHIWGWEHAPRHTTTMDHVRDCQKADGKRLCCCSSPLCELCSRTAWNQWNEMTEADARDVQYDGSGTHDVTAVPNNKV